MESRITRGADALDRKEIGREILVDEEEFGEKFDRNVEERVSQIEVESCTISYLTKKSTCHC